jgi:hypothetical protein
MGHITDPARAQDRQITCHGFVIPPNTVESVMAEFKRTGKMPTKEVFLFKEGVLGALDNEQDATLCAPDNTDIEPAPPKLHHRWMVTCMNENEKITAMAYLNRISEESLDEEESSLLKNAINAIKDIPDCE